MTVSPTIHRHERALANSVGPFVRALPPFHAYSPKLPATYYLEGAPNAPIREPKPDKVDPVAPPETPIPSQPNEAPAPAAPEIVPNQPNVMPDPAPPEYPASTSANLKLN